jgi:Secretion system C-terminal sorting domain
MHTNYLTLLLACCTLSATAQVEFAPIGAVWHYNVDVDLNEDPPLLDYFVYESTGDTLVNNLMMRKVGPYLFYQNGDLVYYWAKDSLNLLYDFGAEVNDTLYLNLMSSCENDSIFTVPYRVVSVDQVMVNNVSLKRFRCESLFLFQNMDLFYYPFEYIERIGSISTIVDLSFLCFTITGGVSEWLRCYTENGEVWQTPRFEWYNQPDCEYRATNSVGQADPVVEFKVFPNPVSTELQLAFSTQWQPLTATIADVSGRVVRQISQPSNVLEVSDLTAGYYWLALSDARGYRAVRGFVRVD